MTTPRVRLTSRPIVLTGAAVATAGAVLMAAQLVPTQTAVGAGLLAAPHDRPAAPRLARSASAAPYAYAWPVKPFRAQHPVRGFFGDPRISNHQQSRQFHFGVDISAPNATPVYATLTGTASIHPLHDTTVLISGPDGAEFSYWHVVPTVRTGQRVVAYRTLIGHIEAPYAHVHFSEMRHGRYLNPLRAGALGPYVDRTRPTVGSVATDGRHLVAEAYDETPLAVPRPWHDLPVMPALVRWRLLDAKRRPVSDWSTALDVRLTIPPASAFDDVWAPGTSQNHVRAPGRYRVVLSRDVARFRGGAYLVEVSVRDTRGNTATRRVPLVLGR